MQIKLDNGKFCRKILEITETKVNWYKFLHTIKQKQGKEERWENDAITNSKIYKNITSTAKKIQIYTIIQLSILQNNIWINAFIKQSFLQY